MTHLRFLFALMLVFCPGSTRAEMVPVIALTEEGSAWRVHVEATFAAQPRQIWSVLTDCGRATAFVPHLASCRIIEKDQAALWDVRENIANPPFLPRIRTIVRSEYQSPRLFTYKLVSGDMRRSEGSWTLVPKAGGTQVTYLALIEPALPAPGFLVSSAIKADLPEMFRRLNDLSLAQAQRP